MLALLYLAELNRIRHGGLSSICLISLQAIPSHDSISLQNNLLHFLKTGVGKPCPSEWVRAAMVLRANSAMKGASGLRTVIVKRLVDFVNKYVKPHNPR